MPGSGAAVGWVAHTPQYVRDPLVIYNEKLEQDHTQEIDHFENIQVPRRRLPHTAACDPPP